MRIKGLRVEVIGLAFLVTAALVFGGQWLVGRYQVEGPLLASARRVDGVQSARLEQAEGRMNLIVTLGRTADFRSTHQRLSELLGKAYADGAGRVVVRDSRTAKLAAALYDLNFALQEGLATGQFTQMRAEVEAQARAAGLPAPYLWVDADRVYLGLRDSNRVLYDVLERRSSGSGVVAQEGSEQRG